MKLCDSHFATLKVAIKERGLAHLVSTSTENLKEKISAEGENYIDGGPPIGSTDPLLGAVWGIYANALNAGGIYLLGEKEGGGEYCPLCELEERTDGNAQDWIDAASNESLTFARKTGLIQGSVN